LHDLIKPPGACRLNGSGACSKDACDKEAMMNHTQSGRPRMRLDVRPFLAGSPPWAALRGMRVAGFALLAALLFPEDARAAEDWFSGTFTGKELLTACKAAAEESVKDFERGICRGFIEGFVAGRYIGDVSHAMHHRTEKIGQIPGRLCIPRGISKTAIGVVFVQFIEKNPDKLGWNAGVLLESALKQSFPCPPE
jgi:Rap1a immunity proteins